jgi:hypothetical protein
MVSRHAELQSKEVEKKGTKRKRGFWSVVTERASRTVRWGIGKFLIPGS